MIRLRLFLLATAAMSAVACHRAQERGDRISVMQSGLTARLLLGADLEAAEGPAGGKGHEPQAPQENSPPSTDPNSLGGAGGSADLTTVTASPSSAAPTDGLPQALPAERQ